MNINDLDIFFGKVTIDCICIKLLKCHLREKLPGNGQMDRIFRNTLNKIDLGFICPCPGGIYVHSRAKTKKCTLLAMFESD